MATMASESDVHVQAGLESLASEFAPSSISREIQRWMRSLNDGAASQNGGVALLGTGTG